MTAVLGRTEPRSEAMEVAQPPAATILLSAMSAFGGQGRGEIVSCEPVKEDIEAHRGQFQSDALTLAVTHQLSLPG